MPMAKLSLLLISTILLPFYTSATTYTVGDNSGWDISTDLDSWPKDKTFMVGDTLLFQYSSSHSVSEVTKENYEGCNMTAVLQSSSDGNTSYPLTRVGNRYFICGNKLHCFGGMKLHVNVEANQKLAAAAPANGPEAQPGGALPPASSKSNSPTSSSSTNFGGMSFIAGAIFGLFIW
ncbi:mavicyanin [Dorcoceras hygrometricum]|uniref:Mavicyanin n=1 Tax=Dorcoceras hygrometricum TaxID=472368 RepID=A0A2Z7BKT8_9LAMI|nr:mavicyanin [Dorcoceras hygrometricum]